MMQCDYVLKILTTGSGGVGKSSLLLKYCKNEFHHGQQATMGIDFLIKVINIESKDVKLQIWDTAGQEKYRSISKSYYEKCHGILLVYDITDRKSFEDLNNRWVDDIKKFAPESAIVLVGNKLDLEDQRTVATKEGQDYAHYLGVSFFEASAKTGVNVEDLFNVVALSADNFRRMRLNSCGAASDGIKLHSASGGTSNAVPGDNGSWCC